MELVIVLAVIVAIIWGLRRRRAVMERRAAELGDMAEDMEQTAAALSALQQELARAVERDDTAAAITIARRGLTLVQEGFGPDSELELSLLEALANLYDADGQQVLQQQTLQQAVALRDQIKPEELAEQAYALSRLADLQLWQNQTADAQRSRKRELDLRRRAGETDTPELLRAQCAMLALSLEESTVAELLRRDIRACAAKVAPAVLEDMLNAAQAGLNQAIAERRDRDAWPAAEHAALLAEALHGPSAEISVVCRGNLAEVLRRNRQYAEADSKFRTLIAELEQQGATAAGLESVYGNMALLCEESGRPEEAAQWRERQSGVLQGEGASIASRFNALNNQAVSLSNRGDEKAAAEKYAQALVLSPEGEDIPARSWAETLNNYGITLANLQRFAEAGRIYQKVLARKKAGADIPLPVLATTFNGLGFLYEGLDKLPQAQDMYERALKIKEQHGKLGDRSLETGWHNLGSVYARLGKFPQAEAMARKLIASLEQRLGPDHPETRQARENLAYVQSAQALPAAMPSASSQNAPAPAVGPASTATREDVEALMVKLTGAALCRYATFDFGRQRDTRVSMVLVPEPEALNWQIKLSRALPAGWRCFVGSTRWLGEEKHEGKAELVAFKSASQFDALCVARTDAVNHDLDTNAIIRQLEDYDRRFGIRILAAETDAVGFMLLRAPENLDAFAQELLDFCMDLEDVSLILPMLQSPSRYVSLWWD